MVIRHSLLMMTTLSLAMAGSACSDNRAEERANPAADGDMVQVEGCLNGSVDGRVVLTAAPDAVGSTAASTGGDRDTHSYVLTGGDNLQAHFGKRVEVSGQLIGETREVEREATGETQTARSASESGIPTVKTTEEVDLEVRQLQVASVRELAPSCQVTP
jgi:hypothetical protein